MANFYAAADSTISQREIEHIEKVRHIASAGMVLLENDGVLPLSSEIKKIALYGAGARHTLKGGTGSGDVNCREFVNLEQGLIRGGFEITTIDWLNCYDQLIQQAQQAHMQLLGSLLAQGVDIATAYLDNPFKEPEVPMVLESDIITSDTDTAIYVLSRNSGEGKDRCEAPGDYYLSDNEKKVLGLLGEKYKNTILLLNIGGIIDITEIQKIKGINAVLLMGQAGNATGDAVVDILKGDVTPSGKLTSTWAKKYEDYPFASEFSHNDGDLDDTWYKEGIYVGYRYFDTFDIEPAYAFGYGKSYTSFQIHTERISLAQDKIMLETAIKNTGLYNGQEVVQVYISAPQGSIDKPYQELKGFAKTKVLKPEESQKLIIEIPISSMASYCEKQAAWILEEGEYVVRVGNSSRDTKVEAVLTLKENVLTEQVKNLIPMDDTFEEITGQLKNDDTSDVKIPMDAYVSQNDRIQYGTHVMQIAISDSEWKLSDVKKGRCSIEQFVGQMSAEEMLALCVGNGAESANDATSIIGAASKAVPGAAGETTGALMDKYEIPNIVFADGPAGLRLTPEFEVDENGKVLPTRFSFGGSPEQMKKTENTTKHYQYCTAIPIATLLAQSWDMDGLAECGDIVGREMEEFGVTLWLAPGMNIQRNPLCGRNFEYYSEDPLISGECAAAITKGVQRYSGKGTTIKHLAVNNQEDNRYFNNSHISERALREVYLKGFEICVKKARPRAIMTSYNLINGLHAANHKDMLTQIVRDEWKFDGVIMTDWGTTFENIPGLERKSHKYASADSVMCMLAGNDLIMPGSADDIEEIRDALKLDKDGYLLGCIREAVKNILSVILNNRA